MCSETNRRASSYSYCCLSRNNERFYRRLQDAIRMVQAAQCKICCILMGFGGSMSLQRFAFSDAPLTTVLISCSSPRRSNEPAGGLRVRDCRVYLIELGLNALTKTEVQETLDYKP